MWWLAFPNISIALNFAFHKQNFFFFVLCKLMA